jgi:hypothetical protein
LYVDGRQIACSPTFEPDDQDVSNNQPLRIGLGSHDYFNGRLADVRIYPKSLSPTELANLANHIHRPHGKGT